MKWLLVVHLTIMIFAIGLADEIEQSGDGSGFGEISEIAEISEIFLLEDQPEAEILPTQTETDTILWRQVIDTLRRDSEKVRIGTLLSYINTDGLPERFQRLTREYLNEMVKLIQDRISSVPFTRQIHECMDRVPDKFYRINYMAYDALHACPQCISSIGTKYVNAVHELVVELFRCLDKNIHPVVGNSRWQ